MPKGKCGSNRHRQEETYHGLEMSHYVQPIDTGFVFYFFMIFLYIYPKQFL